MAKPGEKLPYSQFDGEGWKRKPRRLEIHLRRGSHGGSSPGTRIIGRQKIPQGCEKKKRMQ